MNEKRLKVVIILLSLIVSLLFLAVILLQNNNLKDVTIDNKVKMERVDTEIEDKAEKIEIVEPVLPGYDLYFVIDDVGNNIFQLKPFLELPFNLTFAVLPGLRYTAEAVRLIKAAGKDYIIHQPIESVGGQNPGPGALLLGMSKEQVETIITDNIADYYGVSGMNNHMGSAGTADPLLMGYLFEVLKEKHIYFLDSRTTSKSVAREFAKTAGVPFAERSIFLDNSKDRVEIIESVEEGLTVSKNKGYAVMIGHIWTEELAGILLDLYPSLLENNYALNNLTDLFTGNDTDEDSWY